MLIELMQILKSLSDGIGTAGGVAWTSFGLAFGALGLNMGTSTLAIVLGSISTGLFLLIGLPVTYWSYTNFLKENHELQHAIEEQEKQIVDCVIEYLLAIKKECSIKNSQNYCGDYDKSVLIEDMRHRLLKNISKQTLPSSATSILHQLLDDDHSNCFLRKIIEINTVDKSELKKKIISAYRKSNFFRFEELSVFAKLKTGFIAFCAAFGSLAGCSTGSLGLLTALGIFPGFAAVPIIGWAILGIAGLFGLVVAGISINNSIQRNTEKQLLVQNEAVHHDLKNLVILKNLTISTELKAQKKYQIRVKQDLMDKPMVNTALKRSHSCDGDLYRYHLLWSNSQKSLQASKRSFENSCPPALRQ